MLLRTAFSASNCASPVELESESGKIIPTKSKISVPAEQVYFIYGKFSPAAIALAPIVLPVPAGPRNRKLRICIGFPVVSCACLQISTTSSGMMYQAGSAGINDCSTALKLLLPNSYLPTKSSCSTNVVALPMVTRAVFAIMTNSPATTDFGSKRPESICAGETRIRFPDLSTFTLTWAGQVSSLMRRYALSQRIAIVSLAPLKSVKPLV